ncbi:serine/threonine protein kinase [Roseofilum sp. BLCC_M154]|uniref:non-specific serine/threonine protein kinase n=1 Tax=Roseofilum acuticapitatum BLCC-M154 TaxID=3022444 RepID=A0ABT7AW78_9CYAN|nr:serine/threonine-protein kinase [Roseofilum acuticapitatum]MDJ1170526.1 serine/threonine protein kinase [Roseofilum acuticapitatum BLCC-M154]
MTYCFNLACKTPQNPDEARFCQSCGSKLLAGNRYRALHLLGAGGFGRTLLAIDEHKPSRPYCVIKQFLPQQQGTQNSSKAAELFRREAIQLEPLGEHPQIPQLYAYFTEGDRQYLVQEYIDGPTLSQELEQTGAFSEEKIKQLLTNLLPVLQFIGDRHIIHRDIKPDNIIRCQQDGQLFLVDFGAAKYIHLSPQQQTGTIIGSAAYTAPEQLLGKASYNSDIYSLGVTCLYLLTQIPPFELFDSGENNWVWKDYLSQTIDPELTQILDKMIHTATKYRYQSPQEILTQLNPSAYSTGFLPLEKSQSNSEYALAIASTPTNQPQTTLQTSDVKTEVENALKSTLDPYWVKLKIYWGKKHFTLFLIRDEDTPVNYTYLVKKIEETIAKFSLDSIKTVKIYGRLSNNQSPEWQNILNLTSPLEFFWLDRAKQKLSHYSDQKFWLSQLEKKEFWLDLLLFSLISFVFTARIILLSPILGFLTALGFMFVRNLMRDHPKFQEEQCLKHWVVIGGILGLINIHIFLSDTFALILSAFVIASPIFYIKGVFKS